MYLYSVESKSSICSKLFVVKRPHFSPMFPHEEHLFPHISWCLFFSTHSFYNLPRQVCFSNSKYQSRAKGSQPPDHRYQKSPLSAAWLCFPPNRYQFSEICQPICLSHHPLSAIRYGFPNC